MIKGRTGKAARNAGYGALCQFITILLNFLSRTIFINTLGASYLGISGLFSSVLSMLSMADLGLNTAMVYSFYRPLAENDNKTIAALINFYKKIYRMIAIAVAVIGIAIVPFLGKLVNLDQGIPYLHIYYLFFLANTVVSYLYVYKTSILTADQKGYIISQYQIVTNIAKILLQCLVLVLLKSYIAYLVIQVVFTFLNNFLSSRKAMRLYTYLDKKQKPFDATMQKEIFNNIKSVFIYKVSTVLFNGTDNAIISVLVGTIYVGIYSNYSLIINTISNVVKIFYNAVIAGIGNASVVENEKKQLNIFEQVSTIGMILTPTCSICLLVLLSDLITVWVGETYVLNRVILITIVINFYVSLIQYPVWVHREAMGIYKQTKYVMFLAALINIFLSVFLGKLWGMAGIFAASSIAKVSTYVWYEPVILLKNHFHTSPGKYLISVVRNFAYTVIFSALFLKIFDFFSVSSWPCLFIKTIAAGISSLAVFIVLYWNTPCAKELRQKTTELIHTVLNF